MQILGFLGVLLIAAGVAAAVLFTKGKEEQVDEISSSNSDSEPICDNYLINVKIENQFNLNPSEDCQGDPFHIKRMNADNFYDLMDGLRPVYASEVEGSISDSNTVIYALDQYLNSAVDITNGRAINQ